MRRRSRTRHSTEPSLFPFLAVLICTMGALVVLLVVVVQQARVQASVIKEEQRAVSKEVSEDQVPEYDGPLDEEIEADHLQWRVEILREQRQEILEEFEKRRALLTHLESHIRELEDEAKVIQAELAALAHRSNSVEPLQAKEAELARQRQAIADSRRQVEKLRAEKSGQPAFAIMPFGKGNGTRRRPIYLECVERGIIIQPEGILLRNEDFEGALGPGNPLDAALRTIREYWKKSDPVGAANAYPLMVVRPKGTNAYGHGRIAIKAWDDEFGYELIDDRVELAFPEKSPALEGVVRLAIEDARQRQKVLQRAMPSHPRGGGFVVSRDGGLVPLGGNRSSASSRPRTGAGEGDGGDGVGRGTSSRQPGARQQEAVTEAADAEGADAEGNGNSPSASRNRQGTPGQGTGGAPNPLAESRGSNWALPGGAGTRGTAYTNPIRIAVGSQAIVLLPNNRQREDDRIFVIGDDLTKTVDFLVKAIHQRIDAWGVAPSGGYWQPELRLDVAPDAEVLTRRVETLLRGSGLTLKRSRK